MSTKDKGSESPAPATWQRPGHSETVHVNRRFTVEEARRPPDKPNPSNGSNTSSTRSIVPAP